VRSSARRGGKQDGAGGRRGGGRKVLVLDVNLNRWNAVSHENKEKKLGKKEEKRETGPRPWRQHTTAMLPATTVSGLGFS